MFCHKCGVKLNEGSLFCHACGTKVAEETVQVEQQPVINAQPAQTAMQAGEGQKGTAFIAIGWVAFGLSLICFMSPVAFPIIFGLVALIMGILVIKVRNQTHGIILAVLAVAGALLSTAIGHAVRTVITHYYYNF